MTISQHDINIMQSRLGTLKSPWSEKGIEFLCFRSRGKGGDAELFQSLFNLYLNGTFDSPPVEIIRTIKQDFPLDRLPPEAILIILLGRKPHWSKRGIQERHKSLIGQEVAGQKILSDTLANGQRYINKRKNITPSTEANFSSSKPVNSAHFQTATEESVIPADSAVCAKRRGHLVTALASRPTYMDHQLKELKEEAHRFDEPGFLWHALLQSFSTMLSSRGYKGLIKNKDNYSQVTYSALEQLTTEQRKKRLEQVLGQAKVRMAGKKAAWLQENFRLIANMGGTEAAKKRAIAQVGTVDKIRFARQFAGIGEKYARNLWMDIYHPDFWESIAIDSRINKLTQKMGCKFATYEEHERFYLGIAHDAGLQGWELDRLLYNYTDYFIKNIDSDLD